MFRKNHPGHRTGPHGRRYPRQGRRNRDRNAEDVRGTYSSQPTWRVCPGHTKPVRQFVIDGKDGRDVVSQIHRFGRFFVHFLFRRYKSRIPLLSFGKFRQDTLRIASCQGRCILNLGAILVQLSAHLLHIRGLNWHFLTPCMNRGDGCGSTCA